MELCVRSSEVSSEPMCEGRASDCSSSDLRLSSVNDVGLLWFGAQRFSIETAFFSDLTDLTGSVMGTKCFVSLCGNYIHDVSTLDRTKMCKIASVSVRSNANQGDASQQGMAGSESVKPHAVPCCTTMYRLG